MASNSHSPSPTGFSSPSKSPPLDLEAARKNNVPVKVHSSMGSRPECFRSTFHEVGFIFVTMMAVGMGSFILGSTMIIAETIATDLNMEASEISWLSAGPA